MTSIAYPSRTASLVRRFFCVAFPVFCFAAAGVAWLDGSLWWIGLFFGGWIYILGFIERRFGLGQALQAHILGSIALLLINTFQYINPRTLLEIGASAAHGAAIRLLFFVALGGIAFGGRLSERLKRLEAPLSSDRSLALDYPGVYCITCQANGKQYIGQTERPIRERWKDHRQDLYARRHHNRWLQADWEIYRPEQFTIDVLEVVTDPVWLLDRERYWQNRGYDPARRYNPPNIPPREQKAITKAVGRRRIKRS